MSVVRVEPVTLASGRQSSFKVECDDMSDEEIAQHARLLARILPPFSSVEGVPRGGGRVAKALEPYADARARLPLVVDDVWTTGGSMRRYIEEHGIGHVNGAVLFSRGPTPAWVRPLWVLHERLWDE